MYQAAMVVVVSNMVNASDSVSVISKSLKTFHLKRFMWVENNPGPEYFSMLV